MIKSMKTSSDQLISELTDTFDRLEILEGERAYLNIYIKDLAEKMEPMLHQPYPANFVSKPSAVLPELKELSSRAIDLLRYLETIHQSTILALLDFSARSDLTDACEKMVKVADATLTKLTKDSDSIVTQNTGGRRRKVRELQIATSLAGNYQRLTGKPPRIEVDFKSQGTPAVGDFHRLVDDVFGILGVEANPEYFAKMAIKALAEKTHPKS